MTSEKKPYNDVQELVSQLHIDGMQYREFSTPKPAAVRVVGGKAAPAAAPVVPAAPVEAPARIERVSAAPAVDSAPLLRAVAPAAPLAFTFERLRRQALGSKSQAASIVIGLQARQPALRYERAPIRTLPLAEVFARLNAAADLRSRRIES